MDRARFRVRSLAHEHHRHIRLLHDQLREKEAKLFLPGKTPPGFGLCGGTHDCPSRLVRISARRKRMSRRKRASTSTVSRIDWRSMAPGSTAQETRSAVCSGSVIESKYVKISVGENEGGVGAFSAFSEDITGKGKGKPSWILSSSNSRTFATRASTLTLSQGGDCNGRIRWTRYGLYRTVSSNSTRARPCKIKCEVPSRWPTETRISPSPATGEGISRPLPGLSIATENIRVECSA